MSAFFNEIILYSTHILLSRSPDSPKLRNKQQAKGGKIRPSSVIVGRSHDGSSAGGIRGGVSGIGRPRPSATATQQSSTGHNIVVVKSAAVKETGIEKDDDIVRLQVGGFRRETLTGFESGVLVFGCCSGTPHTAMNNLSPLYWVLTSCVQFELLSSFGAN